MAIKPIRVTRTKQPGGPIPLDCNHPLHHKIAGVVVPAWGVEIVGGVIASTTGAGITNSVDVEGVGRKIPTANVYDQFDGSWSRVSATPGFALLSLYRIIDTASTVGRLSGNFKSVLNGYGFIPNATNGYRFVVSRSGVNTIVGSSPIHARLKCDIGVCDPVNVSLYENGVLTAGPTAHGGVTTANGDFRIGQDSGAGASAIGHVHFLSVVFREPLSAAEVALVSANPWQIFEPELIFKSVAAGGAASLSTAWRILAESTKPAAWRIEAQAVRDLAYAVFGQASRTVAWDLLNQFTVSSAWRLLNQAQHDAAWNIQESAAADAGWRILAASEQASAWQILASGVASVDVAWRVLNSVQQATAARILAQAQRDSGWAVLNQLSLDSGWAVLSAQQQQLLWRILAGEQVDTGWAVLNAISAASSWRVLAQQLMDAGWRISASAALDTAWAVDGIEAVSVESMVFRAGARTLVVDAKARTITFIP